MRGTGASDQLAFTAKKTHDRHRYGGEAGMIYQLNLRSCGSVVHRDHFEAADHDAAGEVAGAVFHSTSDHCDSFDLWYGGHLVTSTITERAKKLGATTEQLAARIEEAMQNLPRFAQDGKLSARIKELRTRHPRAS